MQPTPLSRIISTLLQQGQPQATDLEDGATIYDFDPPSSTAPRAYGANLAEDMEESDLAILASELITDYEADDRSRKEWKDAYIKGLDLLGMKFEERSRPWDGACGAFHPMLSEAVVRFQSQTIQEIFPASGPAKTKVVGDKSVERLQQGQRVEEYLNYLACEEMVEYRPETERLLFMLPLAGSAFRKVYQDSSLGRPSAMFVPAEDFVVAYGTSDLATCERATHIMRKSDNWVRKQQVDGFYRDIVLTRAAEDSNDIKQKYEEITGTEEGDASDLRVLLEMQVDLILQGDEDPDGLASPYIVTIDKTSHRILSIYRNWREGDPLKTRRQHWVHYQYIPGIGFYGFGLVHMIGGLAKSATSLLRQLVDAGTLSNLPGGLKTRGLRVKGDDTPIKPGEFRDVDVPSGTVKENISFLPYKEPSSVLYQLLGDIVNEGRRFASAADVKAADINGEAPVGTTLAILEREMKVMSAIQARIHASMGRELRLLANLVKDHGPEEYPYAVEGEHTIAEDFDERIDIIPVSDPNAGTMAQRIMQYQAALQLAAQAPQMYDMPRLHRQMLEVLGIQEADKVVPVEEDIPPTDPVTENMRVISGEPIKVFMYQDHEAHIQAHMAAAQHPKLQEILGNKMNPKGKQIIAAMADHINEHVAMGYRQQVEQETGVKLPPPDAPLPEDIEYRLSQIVAPAAAQLTGKAQRQQQAEKNAQMQKDPVIQMQMKEVQLKEKDIDSKVKDRDERRAWERQEKMKKLQQEERKLDQKETETFVDANLEQQRIQQQDKSDERRQTTEAFKEGVKLTEKLIEKAEKQNDDNPTTG